MLARLLLLLGSTYLVNSVSAADCTVEAFEALVPEGVSVISAITVLEDGTFGDASEVAYPANTTGLPALCAMTFKVTTSSTSSYRFGVMFPDFWSSRFAAVGNGGLAGGINWPSMSVMAKYNMAVVSTDTGHNGTSIDGRFAINNPESMTDWQYRAFSGSVANAKPIVEAYYGRNISKSYYNGCSTGGRQGLLEMQLDPTSFDGVLAGAPAWESSKIAPYMIQTGLLNLPNTSTHHIPPSMYPIIQAEVLRQCDLSDGVEDGVIGDPEACHFRANALLCTPDNTNTSECLNPEQVNTLRRLYGQQNSIENPLFYHPLVPGSEAEWARFMPGDAPLILGVNSFAYATLQDPEWDWRQYNYSLVLESIVDDDRRGIPEHFDLSEFKERGGKLLHYHGLADTLIPWASSRTFYEHVYSNMTSQGVDIDEFYRLFFVPGLLHCNGGAGQAPWFVRGAGSMGSRLEGDEDAKGFSGGEEAGGLGSDAVEALIRWVEEGEPPEYLVTTKFVEDDPAEGVVSQRRVCPYPKKGSLSETGADWTKAESWVCE